MGEETDEFVHPALDRTYLVSTSRVHGASGENLQTIHVLKDITDRREAERRYRELFDNIQEGLFFSTPEGRFVEVNDALVAMLGYSSREELLQVDIPTQVYFSPEQRLLHSQAMEEHGHMRNFEATLRRKNGSPIYVLINAFGMYDNAGKAIADSRLDARCHRPPYLSIGIATRARFLRQNSQQYAKFHPGLRYRGPGQLRQPALVRGRFRTARTSRASVAGVSGAGLRAPAVRCAAGHAARWTSRQP